MQHTRIGFLALLLALAGAVHAQPAAIGTSIYSCTDGRGRTITADRPIADCTDREQLELRPGGGIRRRIEPTYTPREQAEREERQRKAQQEAARLLEERRRERALLIRYPNPEAHQRERAEAMVQIDAVTAAARKRLDELVAERRRIDDELEFYAKDLAKAPSSLRRRADDNTKGMAVQNRFINEQDVEKKRVNARFDEELLRLGPLWAGGGPATSAR